jgi:hypothetical protein
VAEEDFDLGKAQEFMRQQIAEILPESLARYQQQQRQPDIEQQQRQQITNTIRGAVAGDLDQMNTAAHDTRDYVNFYNAENDLGRLYQKEVEETFDILIKNNRPTVRQDILDHAVGRMKRTNPEEYQKREEKHKQLQQQRAYLAGDIGAGGVGTDRGGAKYADLDRLSKQSDFSDDDIKALEDMLAGETF